MVGIRKQLAVQVEDGAAAAVVQEEKGPRRQLLLERLELSRLSGSSVQSLCKC